MKTSIQRRTFFFNKMSGSSFSTYLWSHAQKSHRVAVAFGRVVMFIRNFDETLQRNLSLQVLIIFFCSWCQLFDKDVNFHRALEVPFTFRCFVQVT